MATTLTTENLFSGNNSNKNFVITFPYLNQADVKVEHPIGTNVTAFSFLNATTIQFTTAPASGTNNVRIYRDTNVDSLKAVFATGSTIRATDLNNNAEQMLFAGQEKVYNNRIADQAVAAANIKNETITAAQLAPDSVGASELASGAAIANIAPMTITGAKIAEDQIDSEHYVASSIDPEHIATSAVETPKIKDEAVTTSKLGPLAVTTAKIGNSQVTRAKIAGDAINGGLIDDDAIDSEHYSALSIDTEHIADNQITNAKMADDAIGIAELSASGTASNSTFLRGDNSWATPTFTLGAESVDSDNYVDYSIDTEHIAVGALDGRYFTETELTNGALDGRYFTETESDARYFNISSGDTIKDGDTFPDNDTTIATTAAINDRIIDLVDEVGGFVPIANELAFPNANPDINDGTGTLVSIKTLSTNYTSNGSGVISIPNGTVGNSTVTINGAENSTTYSSGFGMIVETTTTLNTYTFHRLVPKATEVTTVAGKATEIGRLGTEAAVADLALLGTTAVVSDLDTLADISGNITKVADIDSHVTTVAGIESQVTAVAGDSADIGAVAAKADEIGRLGTADAVADMNTLGTTAIVADMDALADIAGNITKVADIDANVTKVADIDANVTKVADIDANVTKVADIDDKVTTVANIDDKVTTVANNNNKVSTVADNDANVTKVANVDSHVTTVAGIDSHVTTVAGISSDVTDVAGKATEIGRLGTADAVADLALLGTSAVVEDLNLLGTSACVADMALLGDSAVIADMATIADTSNLITNIGTVAGIQAHVTTVGGISSDVTDVAGKATEIGRLGTADAVADMAILGTTDVVADLNTLGTAAVVEDLSILGTADVVSDMNTLATAANVTAMSNCSDDIAKINTCSTNITDIVNVANDATDIGAVAGKATEIGRLGTADAVADLAILGTTDVVADLETCANNNSDISAVADKITEVGRLGTADAVADLAILGTADAVADMNTLATADIVSDMNTLAVTDVVNDMNTLATSSNVSNMSTVAGAISNVNNVGNNIGNVNTVGTSIADVNRYANEYKISSSAPSSPSEGDLWYDDSNNILKYYNGSAWENISAGGIQDIIEDTTPQLGGNLDANSKNITSAGSIAATSLDISGDVDVDGTLETDELTINGTTSLAFTSADHSKLDGIEASATADQTGAEIKSAYEGESDTNAFTDALLSKLNAIEASATADQTDAEIRAAVEAASDSNVFTDADHTKLNGIATSANNYSISSDLLDEDNMASNSATKAASQQSIKAYVDTEVAGVVDSAPGALDTLNELAAALGDDANFSTTVTNSIAAKLPLAGGTMTGNIVMSGSETVDGRDLSVDGAKLDGIEASATADQTAAEIRTLVESATDSNVFTDADHSKLNAIEANATADQTAAEIKTAYESNSDTNAFTDADHSKLDGIASSANNYTHPNHSGEVTSSADGATTIASNVVDEDNLKISNDGSNGQFLQKQSGNTGGLTWADVSSSDETKLPLAGGSLTGDLTLNDNKKIKFGNDGDATCEYNSGSDRINIYLSKDVLIDYAVSNDDGTVKMNRDVLFGDHSSTYHKRCTFGNSKDLQIYHDGSNSYIDNHEGTLYLRGDTDNITIQPVDGENAGIFKPNGAVELYYDNAKKFETVTGGATITGVCTATSFAGDGSNLTGLQAGATGGNSGANAVFWENDQTVTHDYTITDGKNAGSFGPITINNGVTVTVGSGETWTII